MYNTLLCSGSSNSMGKYMPDVNGKNKLSSLTWPTYLAKELNVPLEHSIVAGQSNTSIIRYAMSKAAQLVKQNKKPCIVLLLVSNCRSEILRTDMKTWDNIGTWFATSPLISFWNKLLHGRDFNSFTKKVNNPKANINLLEKVSNFYYHYVYSDIYSMYNLYNALIAFELFCQKNNIPYVVSLTDKNNLFVSAEQLQEEFTIAVNSNEVWSLEHLFNTIDQSKIITTDFNTFVKNDNNFDYNTGYPSIQGHKQWVTQVLLPWFKHNLDK